MAVRAGRLVAVCAAAAAAVGCARGTRRAEGRGLLHLRSPEIKLHAAESRVDTVLGTVLVMPVAIDGAVPGDKTIPAKLDDGRTIEAKLYWVSVAPDGEPAGWLRGPGKWAATPATAGSRPSAAGSWVVMAELPMDGAGQGLTVAGQRVALNWLVDPAMIRVKEGEGPWRRPLGDGLPASLQRMIEPEAASPVRRWRYRLLTRGLEPERAGGERLTRLGDPVLEALAHQTEARWQVALAMLWVADAELAERVKRRLAATVDAGGGVVAPAWPADQPSLDALLTDVLSPRLEPSQKAERAAAWLEAESAGAAWVVDDAGLRDATTGQPVATCGVANLLERTTLAWAQMAGSAGAPELTTVEAFSLAQLPAAAPAEATGAAHPTPVEIHAGRWSASRMLALGRLAASPPGLRVDAMVGDWTMGAWLNGKPDESMAGDPAWAGAALVHKTAAEGPARWWVYLECRSPGMRPGDEDASSPRESVRLWLGPLGHPSGVLRATSSGVVVDEVAVDQGLGGELKGARISRDKGKWIAQIPIPARCIEQDGTLRMALERLDANGRRSAWPRPMLPWQTEPGRVAVDTGAWGDASAAK